jgi:dipeptidyl aminopeptidase/acylaminoacyl peptidase
VVSVLRGFLRVLVVWLGLASSVTAHAQAALIPVEDFFRKPVLSRPQLSPSGDRVGMLMPGPDGRMVLAVADVRTPQRRVGIARFDDADIGGFAWVNDKRLVFTAIDLQSPLAEQWGGGLYAVDVDGNEFMHLIARSYFISEGVFGGVANRPLRSDHVLRSVLPGQGDDVLIERRSQTRHDDRMSTPMLLNTRTRATRRLLAEVPENAVAWVYDRQGKPAAVTTVTNDGLARTLWRQADERWVEIARTNAYNPESGSITPLAVDKQRGLWVTANRGDAAGTQGLFSFDVVKRAVADKPLLALDGFDFTVGGFNNSSRLVFDADTQELLGVRYESDAPDTAWLDERMRDLQKHVDALLPGTVNRIRCERCTQAQRLIVTAASDRQSAIHFLLDPAKQGRDSLTLLGAERPWLDTARLATTEFERFAARDGLSIPAYVTKPRTGKGPWPTVVLVHGGPWVRGGHWLFNEDRQFLASRGYLVVEPEFRGSRGYGFNHFKAGWKQWGLAMQDDVTDAARWAVAKGWADEKRIAIAGGSYGGYAAMMGLVKEPELFRAGINWVGVTDIDLNYSIDWSDFSNEWKLYGMPRLVGDREKDRAQLDRTSPLKRAAEIRSPVLMAYGSEDRRVPLPHGEKMRDALRSAGKVEVEWVVYDQEGHGFLLPKNNVDFWNRVERFLAKHLQ